MHRLIFRSPVRRIRYTANRRKDFCRSFSSTTNNTSTTKGTGNNNPNQNGGNANANNGTLATSVSSVVGDTATSKAGNGSSISSGSGSNIPFGSGEAALKKSQNLASRTGFVANVSYSNNAGINSFENEGSSEPEFRSVYVHPLSQIVLEYLQDSQHEWVVSKGLDKSLTLHRDGSFELKLVPQPHASMPKAKPSTTYKKDKLTSGSEPFIMTSTSATAAMKLKNSNETKSMSLTKGTSGNEVVAKGPLRSQHEPKQHHSRAHSTVDDNDGIRIWTCYDEEEKKHWLTVRRGLFRKRFLLQDNLLTVWEGNRARGLPERLHFAVDEMIRAVDRLDRQQHHKQATTIGQQQLQQRGQRIFRKR